MKIALVGYGKMGVAIEKIAIAAGHAISYKIDKHNQDQIANLSPDNTDVVIEFTNPEIAVENIKICIKNSLPVISGTTGWLDKWNEVKNFCNQQNGTFFYASNYSIGVNLFFKINEYAAKLMSNQNYKVGVEEIHHTEKKDSPSGTAITLANPIIKERNMEGWVNNTTEADDNLNIVSKREPNVAGTHLVTYSSDIDEISFNHIAHGREGFAKGALAVAEWVVTSKSEGMLSMKDFLKF
jgi:4-hydroxy-tetrahydrodipicolinate reductase